jgi:hypothetical protein
VRTSAWAAAVWRRLRLEDGRIGEDRGMTTATIESCLWPLDRRDELAARVAGAANIAVLGPGERFEWSYGDIAPALRARALAWAPAVVRVGGGAGALLGVVGADGARHPRHRARRSGRRVRRGGAGRVPARARRGRGARRHRGDRRARRHRGRAGPAVADALLRASLGGVRVAEGERLRPPRRRCGRRCETPASRAALASSIVGYLAQLRWSRPVVGGRARARSPRIAAAAGSFGDHRGDHRGAGRRAAGVVVGGGPAGDRRRRVSARAPAAGPAVAGHRVDARRGIGQLLGRVVETEALESLALGGGLMAAAGAFELVTGAVILALGIAAGWQLPLLAVWCVAAALLAARVSARWRAGRASAYRSRTISSSGWSDSARWSRSRRRRFATSSRKRRSRATPARGARSTAQWRCSRSSVPRGWLIARGGRARALALGGRRAPGCVRDQPGRHAADLRRPAQAGAGVSRAGRAVIAWRQVAAMFAEAGRPRRALPDAAAAGRIAASAAAAQRARHRLPLPGPRAAVLAAARWTSGAASACLLEGPSGGGKSTLGALLVGLRVPDAGTLALGGVAQRDLGLRAGAGAWARRRSSTRTTSSRRRSCSTCCWGAPGRRAART